jgi:hypothetical protein
MNARFWTNLHDSPIKLTLRPGQMLCWNTWDRDEEGWSSTTESWTLDGDTLIHGWITDGRDCDGRLTTRGHSQCDMADLGAGYLDSDGTRYPKWGDAQTSQRDYSAEAAGY